MNPNICNNCGGEYEYRNGRWVCRACGSYKPETISNEEVTLLYTAFQKLRLAEFGEAEQEFDDILQKYPENPDAYWGRLMSRYGIKYEEDFDGKKIPTCYATSIESVTRDADYQKALRYADAESRDYYRQQAEYIERVRLEWVEKAKKEKPYDIFISYKDSDLASGIERTRDSIAAQEIYIHLLEQGYRVFFSRESLREKTGEKYEPYIFNALSTAKVMLVYGSSAEYIKSTWLKNEWHRFAKRIAAGEKHPEALLVACDGFSPSELPHVLASRQCFDAARRTFFGDLDKAIERIMSESRNVGKQEEHEHQSKSPSPKKVVSALHEHSYKTTVVKSTCVAMGYTLHQCECGEAFKDSFTPLSDHSFKVTERIEPGCKTKGREEETCEVCGQKRSKEFPAVGHQFSKWTESKHPTCTENGEEQRKCLRCGEVEKKSLPKTGHSFGEWVKVADGTYASYCKNCGETKKSTMLPEEARRRRAKRRNAIIGASAVLALLIVFSVAFINFYVVPKKMEESPFVFTKLSDGTYEISDVKFLPEGGVLTIPEKFFGTKITAIGNNAFRDCRNLTSVKIPSSVTTIGDSAFQFCFDLTNVEIEGGETVIGDLAFYNCEALASITLSEKTAEIGEKAFYQCEGLESVHIPGTVKAVKDYAFYGCSNLTELSISDGVAEIGNCAFSSCRGLTEIVIPGSVERIGDQAFFWCDSLTNVVILNGVTELSKDAFAKCTSLTSVIIPESIQRIDSGVFGGCNRLVCVEYTGTKVQWNSISRHSQWVGTVSQGESAISRVICSDGDVNQP